MTPKTLVVFLFLIISCALVSAQSYYADISIDISSSGSASFSGRTNHPLLEVGTTDNITSKKGSYWLFNLTLPKKDLFSDYVYAVNLPQGASVNYVKASGHFRITNSDDRMSIIGSGGNDTLSVVIEYQLSDSRLYANSNDIIIIVGGLLILVIAGVFVVIIRRRRTSPIEPEKIPDVDDRDDGSNLTERQRDILQIIRNSGKPVNQSLICEQLSLPKSSVSRNVDALERKGLITKTRLGMSTLLSTRKKD